MIKQNKKRTLLAALLVLALTVGLLSVLMVSIVSASTVEYKLKIDFNETQCDVYYTVNGATPQKMTSGEDYFVPRGAEVSIKLQTKTGYTINGTYDGKTAGVFPNSDYTGAQPFANEGDTEFTISPMNNDHVYYVQCVNRSYRVEFVPINNGATSTEYGFGTLGTPTLSKTYGDGSTTPIPTPVWTGRTFVSWDIVAKNATDNTYYKIGYLGTDNAIADTTINDDIHRAGVIYLRPVFTPNNYDVIRDDHVYDEDNLLNLGEKLGSYNGTPVADDGFGEAPMGSEIKGDTFGGASSYIGYVMREGMYDSAPGKITVNTTEDGGVNRVIRYFDPITYRVVLANAYTLPSGFDPDHFNYVYNQDAALPTPIRTGYVFKGWTVKIVKGTGTDAVEIDCGTVSETDNKLAAKTEIYADGNEEKTIYLTAVWKPERYTIIADAADGMLDTNMPTEHIYDTPTVIPDPTRYGYIFNGWYINGAAEPVFLTDGKLPATQETWDDPDTTEVEKLIKLKAAWVAKSYTVVLDGNGAGDTVTNVSYGGADDGSISKSMIFDALMSGLSVKIPERTGYDFLGYFTEQNGGVKYFDADGNPVCEKWKTDDPDGDDIIKLYARWQAKEYNLYFNIDKTHLLSLKVDLDNDGIFEEYFIDTNEDGIQDTISEIKVAYRSTITVQILTEDGYKVIRFGTVVEAHTASFTKEYYYDTANHLTIEVKILQARNPAFSIDYANEVLLNNGALLDGKYTVYNADGSVWFSGTVQNGDFTVDSETVSKIPNTFFGQTIRIVWHGDGVNNADSDAISITVAPRPTLSPDLEFDVHERDSKIEISSALGVYEFAISKTPVLGTDAVWQTSNVFTALADGEAFCPGTTYYVFVRIKATASEPHSEISGPWAVTTHHKDFISQLKAELDSSRVDGDGAYVQAVIDKAKTALDALSATEPLPEGFYEAALALVESAKAELPLARERDKAAARLEQKVNDLLSTGAYGVSGEIEMDVILDKALSDLSVAEDADAIDAIVKQAIQQIEAVKINSITATDSSTNTNLEITSPDGMEPDAKVAMVRITDLKLLSDKVNAAIRAGRVVAMQDGVTLDAMLGILNTQEVVAAYTVIVSNHSAENGTYEIRVLIPEDIRNIQCMHVGYYDDATGELKMFETRIDGDYLVFTADKIADFVIIGDPNVSLLTVMIILGVTLLLQIIAIVYLLIRRKKVARTVRLYSSILPAAVLTIRFLPVFGLPVVILLGALVVVAQVILTILLLKSDIIRRRPNDTLSAEEVAENEAEKENVQDPVIDEEAVPAEEQDGEGESFRYAFDVQDGEPQQESDEESTADPFAIYDESHEDTDVDKEDFIEPAVTPRYSLPDEELGEEPVEKATEEETLLEAEDAASDEELYDEVDWAEVDEERLSEAPAEDSTLYYELAEDDEIEDVMPENAPLDEEREEPMLYPVSFEADDGAVEETDAEPTESEEETEKEVEVVQEDLFADIDDSHYADDEVYTEEEVADIDDSAEG